MEDWPKEIFKMLETAAEEVDRFFEEVSEEVMELVDELGKFSEEMAELSEELTEEWRTTIFTQLDRCFEELVDPYFDFYLGLDDISNEPEPFVSYVPPMADRRSQACMGCKHYHGQVYGGNLLICGMHPYGWDTEDCPDWEGE